MCCGYQQHKKNNYKNNGQKKYRKWIVLDYYMNKYEDASGITVQILGFKQAKIELCTNFPAYYPIVEYKAEHKQNLVVGYTLEFYCGKGIGPLT